MYTTTSSSQSSPTRGHGFLENWLSQIRAQKADSLIPDQRRVGRILDIGCGSTPHFLLRTHFAEKYGVDPALLDTTTAGISLKRHDVEQHASLPFPQHFFDVITMLAVYEHINGPALSQTLREIHRVLKPGGRFIVTTPSAWSGSILALMQLFRLISKEELQEHERLYPQAELRQHVAAAGFAAAAIRTGYFEGGLNQWLYADK